MVNYFIYRWDNTGIDVLNYLDAPRDEDPCFSSVNLLETIRQLEWRKGHAAEHESFEIVPDDRDFEAMRRRIARMEKVGMED